MQLGHIGVLPRCVINEFSADEETGKLLVNKVIIWMPT